MAVTAGWTGQLRKFTALTLCAAALVIGLWRLGAPARLAEARAATGPTAGGAVRIFGGALRPARQRAIAFGSPEGRALTRTGFRPSTADEVPAGLDIVEASAELELSLDPDPLAMELVLLGRASGPRGGLSVRINGADAGTLTFGRETSLRRLRVPAAAWVADRNWIELTRPSPSTTVTLIKAWLEPLSTGGLLELGGSVASDALRGFGAVEKVNGRNVRRARSSASIAMHLRPLPTDYMLVAVASSQRAHGPGLELGLTLGSQRLDQIRVDGEFQTRFFPVAVADMPRGTQSVGLVVPDVHNGELLVESVGFVPLLDEVFLDLGRAAARPFLSAGFSFDEEAGERDGVWSSGPVSRLVALVDPRSEAYVLSLAGKAFHPLAPISVRIEVNGELLGTASLGADFAIEELSLPRSVLRKGPNDIVFSYSATLSPARAEPPSTDSRELGVFFDWLELRPVSHGASLATQSAP